MASPIDLFDKDDATHPYVTPEYYEWWYLDAVFPSGWTLIIALFLRAPNSKGHAPGIEMDIYAPDGQKMTVIESFDDGACTAGAEKCDVNLAGNRLRQEGERWLLSARAGKLGADLTFTRTVPGWKPTSTGLMVDDATGKQGWCNPIPRSDVEGTLYFDGRAVPVKGGLGYHDHNWGNVNMDRNMSGWGWGRAHTDRYTLVYGWLLPLNDVSAIRPAIFLARGGQPIFVSGDVPCKVSSHHKHVETGIDVPAVIEFNGKAPWGVDVDGKLTLTKIMDWRRSEQSAGVAMTYFRRLSRLDAKINSMGVTDTTSGDAIDEYVLMPRV